MVRPSILLFVAAGTVTAQRGWHLDTLFVPRRLAVLLVLPFVAALLLIASLPDGPYARAAADILLAGR